MFEKILFFLSGGLFLLASGIYVVAMLFVGMSVLLYAWSHKKYWEEKATFFGLLALAALPLAGLTGALVVICKVYYHIDLQTYRWLFWPLFGGYSVVLACTGLYLLFRHPVRID